jgi:5-methylcytosine-specific restriction endonuclease McrA
MTNWPTTDVICGLCHKVYSKATAHLKTWSGLCRECWLRTQRRSDEYAKAANGLRWCSKCGKDLPREAFNRNAWQSDGLYSQCRECVNIRKRSKQSRIDGAVRARNWRINHRDKYLSTQRRAGARRRAVVKEASGRYSLIDWARVCDSYGNVCLRCGAAGSPSSLEMDHVIPLVKGGSSHPNNFQPLCKSCNSSKHATYNDFRVEFEHVGY